MKKKITQPIKKAIKLQKDEFVCDLCLGIFDVDKAVQKDNSIYCQICFNKKNKN